MIPAYTCDKFKTDYIGKVDLSSLGNKFGFDYRAYFEEYSYLKDTYYCTCDNGNFNNMPDLNFEMRD